MKKKKVQDLDLTRNDLFMTKKSISLKKNVKPWQRKRYTQENLFLFKLQTKNVTPKNFMVLFSTGTFSYTPLKSVQNIQKVNSFRVCFFIWL